MFVLLRHAHAVNKNAWSGDDRERPLSERGFRQAAALIDSFSAIRVRRLVCSPALRCRQTLDPLAETMGVRIETTDLLGKEVQVHLLAGFAESPGSADAILCTHGETLAALLTYWRSSDRIRLTPRIQTIGKNSTKKSGAWLVDDGNVLRGHYLPPPQLPPQGWQGGGSSPADRERTPLIVPAAQDDAR